MSEIQEFASSVPGFYKKSSVDQLLILAWYAEARQSRSSFDGAHLRQCFRDVGVDAPDMSVYLPRLAAKRPPQVLKERGGYRLSGAVRRDFDKRLGEDPTVVIVSKALSDLPATIPDLAERAFLSEALSCYRAKAYRAAIIMAWNLTYDHLMHWIVSDASRLQAMNAGLASKYPKKILTLNKVEDFDDLKESETIETMRVARLLDKNQFHILRDKLNRRNMAAHPSRVTLTQHQADDMITDLVSNIILPLS